MSSRKTLGGGEAPLVGGKMWRSAGIGSAGVERGERKGEQAPVVESLL